MSSADWIFWSWNPEAGSKIWKQIEKARDATEVRTIVVTTIKEQQIDVGRQSRRVWFGDNVVEEIWKCRFTYGPMANMAKTEWVI